MTGVELAAATVASGLLTLATAWAAIPILSRYVLDRPNERSSHVQPVPRAGGLAVLVGTAVALTGLGVAGSITFNWALVTALAALATVGFVDDLRSLGIRVRLGIQVASGFLLAWGVVGDHSALAVVAGAFLTVGFVNSFNFMDGINGISAATTALAGAWYAAHLWNGDQWGYAALASCVAAAALGFAIPNLLGRLFLGDIGSYLLGGVLIGLALAVWQTGASWTVAAAPLVLYVFETALAVLKRAARGARVGEPHREHVYQRLVDSGVSHPVMSLVVLVTSGMLCLTVTVLGEYPVTLVAVWALILAAYAAAPRLRSAGGTA